MNMNVKTIREAFAKCTSLAELRAAHAKLMRRQDALYNAGAIRPSDLVRLDLQTLDAFNDRELELDTQ